MVGSQGDRDVMKCKKGSVAVFPAADASPVPVAFDKAEGHQNKKQKLSDSVLTTTTNIFTRYSRVENHYNVALCSISKSLSLLTQQNVDIDDVVASLATDVRAASDLVAEGPFPAANSSQKRAAIDFDDEGHQIKKQLAASKKKAPPKKRAAKAAPTAALVGQTKIEEIWKFVREIAPYALRTRTFQKSAIAPAAKRQKRKRSVPLFDRSEICRRLARVEAVVLEEILPYALGTLTFRELSVITAAKAERADKKRINRTADKKRINRTPGRSHSPFAATLTPTSSILEFQSWITTRKRSWRTKYQVKDAIEARNIHYFNNHYSIAFPDIPEEEKNHTTVTVIPESEPEAIFKACVNNTAMTLPLAPPKDDRTFCQVGGKLPITDELYNGFTVTGQGMCHIFKKKNWHNSIDAGKYYPHPYGNLAGGICEHGLIPLQSRTKNLGGNAKAYGWMVGLHGADWGIGHVIKNQGVHDDEMYVCVAIMAGDDRLSQYTQYYIKGSAYCKALHPVVASTPVRVYPKDTVEFYPNNIPDFLANAKPHRSVVPLLTKEQKLERQRAYYESEARRCKFSGEHCNKRMRWRCNGMCREHYTQSLPFKPSSTYNRYIMLSNLTTNMMTI